MSLVDFTTQLFSLLNTEPSSLKVGNHIGKSFTFILFFLVKSDTCTVSDVSHPGHNFSSNSSNSLQLWIMCWGGSYSSCLGGGPNTMFLSLESRYFAAKIQQPLSYCFGERVLCCYLHVEALLFFSFLSPIFQIDCWHTYADF